METPVKITPYNAEESKRQQVERMFDNIAPKYDLLNRLLSMGIDKSWRRKAISYLEILNPKEILDVATGTADVALMMSKQLTPKKIMGIDISTQMLDYGRIKIKEQHLEDTIVLETGDSENLRFADDSFDAVTVAFGIRNFENLEKGLKEMYRVLRPGGRAVMLEFSRPHIFPFKQLYVSYFKYVLPFVGKFTSKDPRAYQYLFESAMSFPEGNQMLEKLVNSGYKNTKCERLTLGICSIYIGEK